MPALNNSYENYERPGMVQSYRLANVRVFKGSLVGLNAAGFAVPMNHATGSLRFVGVAAETVDNSSGAAGERSVNVIKFGSFVYRALGFAPTVADLGKEVFANTDWELQVAVTGLTNQYRVGIIVALETASTGDQGIRIRIDRHTN